MGRYVWREVMEIIDGIPAPYLEAEWREDEEPDCARCSDYGEWVDEDGVVSPCPDCAETQDLRP